MYHKIRSEILNNYYAPPWRSILFSSCPFATEVVVSVRNGSQLTGVPWDLRLAGHTSATHTFLVSDINHICEVGAVCCSESSSEVLPAHGHGKRMATFVLCT